MKFVLAPDKFKDSLTGLEFCYIFNNAFAEMMPEAKIINLPIADGGDGTIEVVNHYLQGEKITITVNNPIFQPIKATYLYAENSKTAFIEMAEASGLKLLKPEDRNPKKTTTFGTGELIVNAINNGVEQIILGIGGSATNDCGIGMAQALGYRFLNTKGEALKPIGENLIYINSIDASQVHPKLKGIKIKVACDVTNQLYGKNGAAYVYAKQKGANPEEVEQLNKGLEHFAMVLNAHFKINSQHIIGAGAAGGMGIGTTTFLNAKLSSGITLIKELAKFDEKIKNADWIITGEGNLDMQTYSGKAVIGVINSAKKRKIPVAVFCGNIDLDSQSMQEMGINYSCSVMDKAKNFEDAMKNTKMYVKQLAVKFANFIKAN